MSSTATFDCIVVGGGPAGLAAAGAIALRGLKAAIVLDRRQPPAPSHPDIDAFRDTRTAALFPLAVAMLRKLGAWEALAPQSAPLSAIRLVDDSGRLLRAPEIVFRAAELGLSDLGHNIANSELVKALAAAAAKLGVETIENGRVVGSEAGPLRSILCEDGRRFGARLVVAADGRESLLRDLAQIGVDRWTYDQAALATRFAHSRPHGGISTELHGDNGPCTTVPLAGLASSLVWMDKMELVEARLAASPETFLRELGTRLSGLLGTLGDLGPRRSFPLAGLVAKQMGRDRIALVGEAAHAMPPIGAQGLNLGLTDGAVLADLVADAARRHEDIGSEALLRAYDKARSADVHRRVNAVDLLNRSVRPSFWPLGLARGAGLHVLAAMPSLRRRLMREGLFPPDPVPSVMRPPAENGRGNPHDLAHA